MGMQFGGPKIPAPPPPPPPPPNPPTMASSGVMAAADAARAAAATAGGAGFDNTLLTGGQGTQSPATATKALVGT